MYNEIRHLKKINLPFYDGRDNVTTASFLTEDSYLGRISEPLTLNRYSYCIGNPVNYDDPSGHVAMPNGNLMPQIDLPAHSQRNVGNDFITGVGDSIVEGLVYLLELAVAAIEWVDRLLEGNPTDMREISAEMRYNLETYLDTNAAMAENKTAFYAGRCVGSALVIAGMYKAGSRASANGSGGKLSSGGSMVLVTPDGRYINAGGSAGLGLPPGVLAGDAPLGDWKNQIKESGKDASKGNDKEEISNYKKENRVPLDKETVLKGADYKKQVKK